jgi:hypothetical protein
MRLQLPNFPREQGNGLKQGNISLTEDKCANGVAVLRTLQRRVQTWKVLHGEPPEVMFELKHEPGMMGEMPPDIRTGG